METKPWWKSKTVWVNLIVALIWGMQQLGAVDLHIAPQVFVVTLIVLNTILRFISSGTVTLTTPPAIIVVGLLLCGSLQAQVVTSSNTDEPLVVPAPSSETRDSLTLQQAFQNVIDAATSGATNWYVTAFGTYVPKATTGKEFGAGMAAFYPVSQYVLGGVRLDWCNGGFYMPSGNVTLQLPLKPFKSVAFLPDFVKRAVVTPFTYAGVGVPISGGKFGRGNGSLDGDPVAIVGAGAALHLGSTDNGHWSFNLVGDIEQWSGVPGNEYRLGPEVTFKY